MLRVADRQSVEQAANERTIHVVCGVCGEAVGWDPVKLVAFCGFDKLRREENSLKPERACTVCVEMSRTTCGRCGIQNF